MIIIQSTWRMRAARKQYLFLEARRYCRKSAAAILIQSYWRMALAAETYRTLCQHRQAMTRSSSAIAIQALWKMQKPRRVFLRLRSRCLVLQAWWRKEEARRHFHKCRESAIAIQSKWRASLCVVKHRALQAAYGQFDGCYQQQQANDEGEGT